MKTLLILSALILSVAAIPAQAQFAQAIGPLVIAQTADKPGQARPVVDDREVALRVQSALYKDKRLAGLGLNVKAADGIVELSGRADSQSQADHAVTVARAVAGVKSVTSEIRVN